MHDLIRDGIYLPKRLSLDNLITQKMVPVISIFILSQVGVTCK